LDEYMSFYDAEAQRKAAQRFEEIVNEKVMHEGISNQTFSNTPRNNQADDETLRVLSSILMNAGSGGNGGGSIFPEQSGKMGEEFGAEERQMMDSLLRHLSSGTNDPSSENSSVDTLMETMIKAAVSKEVMYSSVKELHEKYSCYLAEHNQLEIGNPENAARYNKQFELLGLLKQEYEREDDEPMDSPDATSASASGSSFMTQAPKSITDNPRATRIAGYWLEMQALGMPPPELQIEGETENATNPIGQKDACSIM